MSRLFMTCCLWMMVSLSVWAQNKPYQTPEQRATHQSNHLTTELQLSAEQTAKVKDAALLRISKIEAAQNHVHKRSEIKHAVEEFESSMKIILTADQYTRFHESEHRSPEEKAEVQTRHWTHHLQLNEEQSHKVRDAILTRIEKTEEVREIHKDGSQKEGRALKVVLDEFNTTMKQVLNETQFSKFEQMMGNKKGQKNKAKQK